MSDFLKWGIYRASLDPVIGSEQGKSRPVLIISENELNELVNTVNILPITSLKPGRHIYPNEVLLPNQEVSIDNDSIVLCHQIRTIDKIRLTKFYGIVESFNVKREVLEALSFQLGIELK
ncbi:type II toxin-antitoxin system PemK/MazF family toxin [Lacihabitans sp. LS3-19]|uniref:type II toxin-antitoxin system PemK/MazF family toxin n=1 Tax=Lacihabitans sp. LS3-19 TaxID=2487335 RepID=UPI0020CFE80B|nr:type II toxin-antitoxin system PemK/MazF family toxin [Lacihabitans sp. LS3-19]MCP9766299.1 type II toxin-antitoxin system PemK/MazF family toxin [Lacihabitans sp. LS3-19]